MHCDVCAHFDCFWKPQCLAYTVICCLIVAGLFWVWGWKGPRQQCIKVQSGQYSVHKKTDAQNVYSGPNGEVVWIGHLVNLLFLFYQINNLQHLWRTCWPIKQMIVTPSFSVNCHVSMDVRTKFCSIGRSVEGFSSVLAFLTLFFFSFIL